MGTRTGPADVGFEAEREAHAGLLGRAALGGLFAAHLLVGCHTASEQTAAPEASGLSPDKALFWAWNHFEGNGALTAFTDGRVRFETWQMRGMNLAITEGQVSAEVLSSVGERLAKDRVCRRSSKRDGVPDEARPQLSVRLGDLDCTVFLWDGEWDELPATKSAITELRKAAQAGKPVAPEP